MKKFIMPVCNLWRCSENIVVTGGSEGSSRAFKSGIMKRIGNLGNCLRVVFHVFPAKLVPYMG